MVTLMSGPTDTVFARYMTQALAEQALRMQPNSPFFVEFRPDPKYPEHPWVLARRVYLG